jgi:hypothetical protein
MSDEITALLGSAEYEAAFNAVMTGSELAALPQEQRDLLLRARELTGTSPPGYPMPGVPYPTRSDDA